MRIALAVTVLLFSLPGATVALADRSGAKTAEGKDAAGAGALAQEEKVAAGRRLYEIYCRSCHGAQGRGDGPAAGELRPAPADLTGIRRRNHGSFPAAAVRETIDGRARLEAHAAGRMPVWGIGLQQLDSDADQEREVAIKIDQLVEYLRSIQSD